MVDIHCHILPGLDDGADNIEESLRMARLAVDGGTQAIIATPHCNIPDSFENYFGRDYAEIFNAFKEKLRAEDIPLKIYPGHEIFSSENIGALIKKRRLLTLAGSDYPLVEFGFTEAAESVYEKLRMLVAEGLTPIVAHPERYGFVAEDDFAPYRLKALGCLLQINKGSLKGNFGREAYTASAYILENELADFVASDAHSPYMRTPYLADAYELISEAHSRDYADLLLKTNPAAVIQNKKIN